MEDWSGEGRVIGLDVEVRIRPMPGVRNGLRAHEDIIGVIDTGADKVLIPRGIAKRLGLTPINYTSAVLASGEKRAAINYAGILEIPAIAFIKPMEMTAMTEGAEANHILLGKNFLSEFLVTIDCANGVCWFNKPGQRPSLMIDDE